jgi:hypothetical protein
MMDDDTFFVKKDIRERSVQLNTRITLDISKRMNLVVAALDITKAEFIGKCLELGIRQAVKELEAREQEVRGEDADLVSSVRGSSLNSTRH